MRKLVIIVSVLFGLEMSSYSQLKYFFPDSNACFSVSYVKYWFQGDIVIENVKCKKVYRQYNDSIADFNKAHYYAAIWEDTVSEKIYCFHNGDTFLLYDFAVNVGDIVRYYSLWMWSEEQQEVVESIDSILIDGQYRKRINFLIDIPGGEGKEIESWIEGIGSTNGLFSPGIFNIADIGYPPKLLCVHIDERVIYQIKDNCFIPIGPTNIIEPLNEGLKIYPNPAGNQLTIECGATKGEHAGSPLQIEIYDVVGQRVGTYQFPSFGGAGVVLDSQTTPSYGHPSEGGELAPSLSERVGGEVIIDISHLAKGMYFLKIYTDKGITIKKFVKQ